MLLSSLHVPVCRLDYQGHGVHLGFMHISLFSQMLNSSQHAKYALQTPLRNIVIDVVKPISSNFHFILFYKFRNIIFS